MLRHHPEINVSMNKEPCFFSENYNKGFDWYKKNWSSKKGIKGEFTNHYIFKKEALEKLKKDFPNVKIIVLLREPISRSISHYRMVCRYKNFQKNIKINDLDKDIIYRSYYFDHISFLFKTFSKKQILVEYYDNILQDPQLLLDKVNKFLNVQIIDFSNHINKWHGKGYNPKYIILTKVTKVIHEFLSKREMYKLILFIKKIKIPDLYKFLIPTTNHLNPNHIELIKAEKENLYLDLKKLINS